MKAKKRKIIKRVYEKGREMTVFSARALRRQNSVTRKPPKAQPSETAQAATILMPATRRVILDNYQLPAQYDTTRLTLMVKDPFWLYAYWEIAPSSIERLKNIISQHEIDSAKIVLRMYNVTMIDFNGTNASHYFDIEAGPSTNNWYINLWHDNVSYVGEIGLRLSGGRFFPFARSNFVHMPRIRYSARSEQIWMNVTDQTPPSAYVIPGTEVFKFDKTEFTPLVANGKKRAFYLTEEDIRQYYGRLSPLLRDIISTRLSETYGIRAKYGFILEGETDQQRRRLLKRLPKDYFLKRILIGSSEELISLGASEQLMSGASEFVQRNIEQRKFFFELSTEVIVYGRTEPGAEVYLGDKKIDLREDGTFSLRLTLPDGKLPLEFKAVSKDKKEIKNINTYIQKATNYV